MPSAASVLGARVLSACRASAVAAAAGVAAGTWADATTSRVFHGLAGYLGGRNRGRLPFIEYEVQRQTFDHVGSEGGDLTQRVVLRAHCGGSDLGTAEDLTAAILGAAIAAIRSQATDNLCALGDDEIGPLTSSPWGHQRDATVVVIQSYDRTTSEVT